MPQAQNEGVLAATKGSSENVYNVVSLSEIESVVKLLGDSQGQPTIPRHYFGKREAQLDTEVLLTPSHVERYVIARLSLEKQLGD